MPVTRRGFTLTELIVSITLAAGSAAFMIGTLTRQERFHSSASVILDTRAQLRDAADVLVTDLRSASVAIFGIPVMTDSAIEVYTTIASSVVCVVQSSQSVSLPPIVLASGNTLTSMQAQPDTGDLALIYGVGPGPRDSARWESVRVASYSARSLAVSCPVSSGFTTTGDEQSGATGFLLTLAASPQFSIRPGTPLHFVRRVRYSLYRSSDSKWYLGHRRCNAAGSSQCDGIQPVAGPYEPYGGAGPGLSFRYYDLDGDTLPAGPMSANVARIDIVLRGRAGASSRLSGDGRLAHRDSVIVSVSPRNRLR